MDKTRNDNLQQSILLYVNEIIENKFKEEPEYTGKIIIEINCRSGYLGSVEAYIKRKIIKQKLTRSVANNI